jgi:hypothetical protein
MKQVNKIGKNKGLFGGGEAIVGKRKKPCFSVPPGWEVFLREQVCA